MLPVLALSFAAATLPAPTVRPLFPGGSIRDSLAGRESVVYQIDVPANSAARVVVRQEGIDVDLTLRPKGSQTPAHGLDFVAGVTGDERAFPPIAGVPTSWDVRVSASLPRAARGDYTISFEVVQADDHARALAAAYQRHHQASNTAWIGDGKAFQLAQAEYAAAADAALAADDLPLAAESTYQCARVHDNLGDTPGAIDWQQQALILFERIGQRDRQARVLNRLGDLSRKVGEIAASEGYFERALPLAREARDPVAVADILNNSGLLMLSTDRDEAAIARMEAAVPLAQEVDSANVEAALVGNIAEAYRHLGRYDKSIEIYQRGLEVVARLKLPRRTARMLHSMATAYFEQGDLVKAASTIRRSLDLYDQAQDRAGLALAVGFAGRVQYANGDITGALESFARAVPLLRDAHSRGGEASVLRNWAEVEIGRGELDAALEKLDRALALSRVIASSSTEAHTLYLRATALEKQGRTDAAIASLAGAIDIVEAMRGAIQHSELRTSYLSTVRGYFDLYIDLLQRQGAVAAAFELSERARARTLLDGLAASAAKISKGVDAELLSRQRAVQAELNAKETYRAEVALAEGATSPRALAASRDVERLLDRWTDARARIRAASPAYAALELPEPVKADRVQRTLLDQDSALVEYHLGTARSYAWVIDRESITAYELAPGARIEALARRYHEMLSRDVDALGAADRDALRAGIATVGRRLAAVAWTPIEPHVRGKRLLIVADGALQYVPFAALPASGGGPLLARHEIAYLPSASVLETIRRNSRPVQPGAAAAVFADPVFSKNDPRLAAQRDAAAPARTRADDGLSYARLRFSRREAEAIAAASPGAFEALDFAAAKPVVVGRDLRRYRILHFATHGTLNTEHPELSGLVFSLVDANGQPTDGFLRLHEIYNLDLDADLVVLSACRTALGKEVHGEGLIGLTRGFMYAGASRVVSSVWNIDDRASALLMSRFYAAMLSKHLAPAAALRDAQLSLLRDPRWTNAHYWAAFGLQGEWK